jgi:hypothetical protein
LYILSPKLTAHFSRTKVCVLHPCVPRNHGGLVRTYWIRKSSSLLMEELVI